MSRDEPGGYLLTDQVVSGVEVARAWLRLWCGTWEPGPRYRRPFTGPFRSPGRESETPKRQKPRGVE